ncbi:hypothetical protein GWI33_014410 [Rhynchophorus ferrugineus]|uniref:Uncharacterized protein n=1 Tax=Rhynchophorus ferrugineus TaxID=354439 RepID=A0A834M5J7_RHYFE|nr:hypothetical protein GWI33_014410 [Rhynchophorus ferrugineus]
MPVTNRQIPTIECTEAIGHRSNHVNSAEKSHPPEIQIVQGNAGQDVCVYDKSIHNRSFDRAVKQALELWMKRETFERYKHALGSRSLLDIVADSVTQKMILFILVKDDV